MVLNTISLISGVIIQLMMIPINAFLLMISTKIFKITDSSFKSALKIALILGVVSIIFVIIGNFIPSDYGIINYWLTIVIVSIVLAVFLIKNIYSLDGGKSALVWLVWFVLSITAMFLVGFVVEMIVTALGIGALAALASSVA